MSGALVMRDIVPHRHNGRVLPDWFRSLFVKGLKFTAIGIFGALIDYGTRQLMLHLGVWPFAARGISYIVGSTFAYYANSFLTFSGDRSAAEKMRATVTYIVCFCAAVLVDFGWRHTFPEMQNTLFWSWFASQATATILNFSMQNLWVFKAAKPVSTGE
ncbi:hypothetical protein GCM10009702_08780 [Propioniferax innocua]